jgi:squalene-hopene/tetraprenyl-beta-curcumene cyclase
MWAIPVKSVRDPPLKSTMLTPSDRDRLQSTCRRAQQALLSLQKSDGHWCGELQGDSILESEYILMKFILGQERAPMRDGRDGWETLTKIANYLRKLQRADGGWGQYPGSDIDLSATVKAYFALKLMGDDSQSPHMIKAKEVIRTSGALNSATVSRTSTWPASVRFHGMPCPPFPRSWCICRAHSIST